MTTFNVEVVLKGRDYAVTEAVVLPHGEPATWDEAVVYDMLVETLRAIDRVQNPGAPRDRGVVLTGFSWIVEPEADKVVLAIEIPMGAAIAGPFAVPQARLDALIHAVIRAERQRISPSVVH
jgi:predicted phosphatase